jgi:hypothetical protein
MQPTDPYRALLAQIMKARASYATACARSDREGETLEAERDMDAAEAREIEALETLGRTPAQTLDGCTAQAEALALYETEAAGIACAADGKPIAPILASTLRDGLAGQTVLGSLGDVQNRLDDLLGSVEIIKQGFRSVDYVLGEAEDLAKLLGSNAMIEALDTLNWVIGHLRHDLHEALENDDALPGKG